MSASLRRREQLKNGAAPWAALPEKEPGQHPAGNGAPAEPILEAFFSKEELAAELGRNSRTLDRWEILGTGPPRTYIGRKVYYNRRSVLGWIAAQERRGRAY